MANNLNTVKWHPTVASENSAIFSKVDNKQQLFLDVWCLYNLRDCVHLCFDHLSKSQVPQMFNEDVLFLLDKDMLYSNGDNTRTCTQCVLNHDGDWTIENSKRRYKEWKFWDNHQKLPKPKNRDFDFSCY